jgi:hypothetical protein
MKKYKNELKLELESEFEFFKFREIGKLENWKI